MTQVTVDLRDVGGVNQPGDHVVMWSPHLRVAASGALISTAPHTLEAPGIANLEPGPMAVRVHSRGWRGSCEKVVEIPVSGPVTLWSLLEGASA